jgi:membrane protein DedA with SNARE-associated domain/pimeloyl-ACP methyl ester carboxylesterase
MSDVVNVKSKMPAWYWFAAFYLLSLLMSWSMAAFLDDPQTLHMHQRIIEIENDDQKNPISYYHFPVTDQSNKPILLLHDNHFGAVSLVPLAEKLNESGYEVIIPEYPGYGYSRYPGGFSIDHKTELVTTLLDELNVNDIHLLGHGMGGAIAFYLSNKDDIHIQSLVLLSAFASPNVHLLGNHTLNRTLYLLQFPVYYGLHLLTPHFGWLNELAVSRSSIRSNYYMDLRPVSEYIRKFQAPVTIIHGENDRYVNVMTAKEHHRILPQSELIVKEGGQHIVSDQIQFLADEIKIFLSETESGETLNRSEANTDRVQQSELPFDREQVTALSGLALALMLLLLVLTTFISEDLACIGAGLLAAKGILNFIPAVIACFTGILLADVTIYWLGRWLGSPVLSRVPFRWLIDEEDVDQAEQTFKQQGVAIIFLSRFIPGTRFPVYFTAGMVRAKFTLFLIYFILAILLWTPLIVGVSYFVGHSVLEYFYLYQDYAIWILLFIVLVLITLFKIVLPALTTTGRRRLQVRIEKFKRRF